MDLNQQFFISILSDHLYGISTEIQYNVDWDVILKLSKSHQVEGIVYHQCKKIMPPEMLMLLDCITSTTLYYYANRRVALDEVIIKLNEKEITHVIVKGFSVAEYYPVPALRTMGDCDIIVHRKDMPATMNVMRSLGYQGIDNEKADSWECAKNKLAFEIHDKLVSGVEFLKPEQEFFFNNYDIYVVQGKLDWSFHFLFLIIHLRKHFMNSGIGIRQFIDLAVLIQNCQELNWAWIREKLAELDLLKFAQSCFWLLKKWFAVEPPIGCNSVKMDQDYYEQVTERILKNGVFGRDDIRNIGNYERNVLIKSEGWMAFRRFGYVIRNIFPPYAYMRTYPGCNYVDGRPYLLMIAWMHRFFYYSKRKNRNTVWRVMKGAFSDKERLEEQEEFLDKMGV